MEKLAIIIPYRDREQHLKKFIPHMNQFLKNKIVYDIYLIEQCDDKPFNRAKLLNIGFVSSQDKADYFCFHDIDLLPINAECDYSPVVGVCKMSYYVSQFNFVTRPTDELGGVTLIDKESFIKVNGYCNLYYGWGVEDNDFGLRCKTKNVPFSLRKGRYLSLPHKPNGDTYGGTTSENTIKNRKIFSEIINNKKSLFDDGIDTLEYNLLGNNKNENFIHIKVHL